MWVNTIESYTCSSFKNFRFVVQHLTYVQCSALQGLCASRIKCRDVLAITIDYFFSFYKKNLIWILIWVTGFHFGYFLVAKISRFPLLVWRVHINSVYINALWIRKCASRCNPSSPVFVLTLCISEMLSFSCKRPNQKFSMPLSSAMVLELRNERDTNDSWIWN